MSTLRDFLLAPSAGGGADGRERARSRAGGGRGAVRPLARLGSLLFDDRPASGPSWPGPDVPFADESPLVEAAPRSAAPDGRAIAPASTDALSALAMLCAPEDARALGVAAGVVLARAARAPTALACLWTAPDAARHPDARPPSVRGARRLAAALTARGLDAVPSGRVATVALPADPSAALAAAGRAAAAAGAAPVVLVLGGPRDAAFDELLAVQDRLLVVARPGSGEAIAGLALAGLPDLAPPATTCTLALGPAGRALAAAGVAVPAPLRSALREPGRPR